MRSLLAVLVLAVAAAAEEIPVKTDVPIPLDEMRLVSLYGLPKGQCEFGVRDIYNKPMFLAVRMEGKKEVVVFLLREGFKSMYMDHKFDILREFILSGPEKVAMMLSAAHALDLPEMRFNIHDIQLGSDSTPVTALRLLREPMFPFVFLTTKTVLPAGSLERLFELGQFQVRKDDIMILKDLMPVEDIPHTYTRFLRDPGTAIIETPIFESEVPIVSRQQLAGRLEAAHPPHTLHTVPNFDRLERIEQPIYRQPYPYRTRYPYSFVQFE